MVVWPSNPRAHKVRKKDCVRAKPLERDSEDVVDKVSASSGSFAVRLGVFDSPGSVRSEQC